MYYAVIVSDVEMFDQAGRAGPEYGHGRDNLLHARNFEHLKQFAVFYVYDVDARHGKIIFDAHLGTVSHDDHPLSLQRLVLPLIQRHIAYAGRALGKAQVIVVQVA